MVYIQRPFYCYRNDNPNSSFKSKQKVYAPATEYEFIRQFLSNHSEFEKDVLPVYYMRMFRIYHQTYQRIAAEFKEEFLDFFYKSMCKARDLHELDTGVFTTPDREKLELLLDNPKMYAALIDSKKAKTKIRVKVLLKYLYYRCKRQGVRAVWNQSKKRFFAL